VDIISLSKTIKHDNIFNNMAKFFDENIAICNIMSMYNITCDVSTSTDMTAITYIFNSSDTENLMNILSNAAISIYGHMYVVNIERDISQGVLRVTLFDGASIN